MKKIILAFLIFLLLLSSAVFFVSCSKPHEDDTSKLEDEENNGDSTKNQDEISDTVKEMINGRVISVTKKDENILSFVIYSETKDEYLMNVKSDFTDIPELGDEVSVFIDGKPSETSPQQATAIEIQVAERFSGALQPTDVYSVRNIDSTKLSETMGKASYVFRQFNDYAECQNFLEDNYLTDKFDESVKDIDISALTDSFFKTQNLYLFIVNESSQNISSNDVIPQTVFIEDETLFMKTQEITKDAPLPGVSYRLYLIPLPKETKISDGIVLLERILNDNLHENDESEEITESESEEKSNSESESESEENSSSESESEKESE